eukprot:scaffold27777_cov129-Isochrysis_galbana.AAC.9
MFFTYLRDQYLTVTTTRSLSIHSACNEGLLLLCTSVVIEALVLEPAAMLEAQDFVTQRVPKRPKLPCKQLALSELAPRELLRLVITRTTFRRRERRLVVAHLAFCAALGGALDWRRGHLLPLLRPTPEAEEVGRSRSEQGVYRRFSRVAACGNGA